MTRARQDDAARSPTPGLLSTTLPVTLLRSWHRRFVNRDWPYAVQQPDGSYRWRYEPCDLNQLAGHLLGEQTLALSSTDTRARTKWLCLDVDSTQPGIVAQLVALRLALAEQGWTALLETSRRGGHLWFLLDRAIPAQEACEVLLSLLVQVRAQGITVPTYELYPDRTQPGLLSHAVRLPLAVHQLTGQRYPFLDVQGQPLTFTTLKEAARWVMQHSRLSGTAIRQQWKRLTATPTPTAVLSDQTELPEQVSRIARNTLKGTYSPVIRWVDAQVSPLDLLADLAPDTEMRKVGRGYLGWCPFHDDRAADEAGRPGTPSFYVVQDRRYGWSWKCFSTNCAYSWGYLRHSFELFQRLLDLSVKQAIVQACQDWPEAGAYRAVTGEPEAADIASWRIATDKREELEEVTAWQTTPEQARLWQSH